MQLNPEDILLLNCVKPNLSQQDFELISTQTNSITNWDSFLNNAIQNRLSSIVYKVFLNLNCSANIPPTVTAELQKHYYKTLSKNTILYSYFTQIMTECLNKKIPTVALKGIFLADNVYDDIGIRQLSDIDLFVHEHQAQKCADILITMGFTFDSGLIKSVFINNTKDSKHLPMLVKNGVGVEIHTSLLISNSTFHIPIADFWKNVHPNIVAGINTLVFNPNYLLLHICMHLDEHFIDAKIHFIAYVDIIWILETYKTEIDWNAFDEMCEKYNCAPNIYMHLYLCNKYLDAQFPEKIIAKLQPYCSKYTEEFFINHLQCNSTYVPKKKNRNISELNKVIGFQNKIRFLLNDLFPSKTFMITRYKIKKHNYYFLYYPVRLFDGIVSLLKYMLKIKRI